MERIKDMLAWGLVAIVGAIMIYMYYKFIWIWLPILVGILILCKIVELFLWIAAGIRSDVEDLSWKWGR